jgi:signal transduction histidine kinase/ActR/RegA family two-component response regulator
MKPRRGRLVRLMPIDAKESQVSTPESLHQNRFDCRLGVVTVAAMYSVAGGAVTLLGWALQRPRLTDWADTGISMFPNTALCAGMSGIALLLLARHRAGELWRTLVRILAIFVAVIGGLTLLEHVSGSNLGIDTLLFDRPWGQRAAAAPMRMGPPASISFLILGAGLLLATGGQRARSVASALAILPVAISSLSIIGFWFGSDHLYTVVHLTGIAIQTSTILAMLGVGLMAAVPEQGVVSLLCREDAGGMLVRKLWLPIIIVPLFLGWLRLLGEDAGLFDRGFGLSALLLTTIAMLLALLALTASSISRAAQTNKHSRDQLEAFLKKDISRKNAFLATLAHELRNPLAPIVNSLQLIRMKGIEDLPASGLQEIIERQVNHMVRLVDDLLELSRINNGKINLRPEPIEIAGVLRSAVETSRPLIEAGRHELTMTMAPEPLTVVGDAVRLSQVVANLLNNAAKYTEPGGQIWLAASRENGDVSVSVRDSGIGISPGLLPELFQMFSQADKDHKRSQGGLGIGLALAKSLIELHCGRIEAYSEGDGRGSEFIIRLPFAEGQRSVADPNDLDSCEHHLSARSRVLIVDDNQDAALSLAMLLRALGNDVRTADNGHSALEAIPSFKPDVVLLDLGMPGMSGYEVAVRARVMPAGRECVLVALTGWGQEEDRRRSREAGFNHHLLKPVDVEELKALLSESQDPSRSPDASPVAR